MYAERIDVPDGVNLEARVPGTVTVRRAPGSVGAWVAIVLRGTLGGRLAGVRIESTPDAPIDVALQVAGQGRIIELLDVIGPVQAAVELLPSASAVLQGSVLEVPALAVRLEDGARATLTNNIVSRLGRTRGVPISLTGAAQLTLSRNVFSGFGPVLVERAGASVPPDTSSNFVIGVEPRGAR